MKSLMAVLVSLAVLPTAFAGPLALHPGSTAATENTLALEPAPITFELSDPGPPEREMSLESPKLIRPLALGFDSLLERVVSVPGPLKTLAKTLLAPADTLAPRELALKAVAALSWVRGTPPKRDLKLTTHLDSFSPKYGEFSTRDWNALGDTTGLSALTPLAGAPFNPASAPAREPPQVAQAPAPAAPKPPVEEMIPSSAVPPGLTSLRRNEHGLAVSPEFGGQGFSLGAPFSLSDRTRGRAPFAGFFDTPSGFRPRIGFESTYQMPDGLRLSTGIDQIITNSKTQKEESEGRLWTGVVFNF